MELIPAERIRMDSIRTVWEMNMGFRYSEHARTEMARRGISAEIADGVLQQPEQIVLERAPRKAYQSRVEMSDGKTFLVRLIVDDSVAPAVVVTAYRTTKIQMYWRQS